MTSLVLNEVQEMVESYTRLIKDRTILKQINNEWAEITTPSLDRHNDYLQIYVRQEGDSYLLSDGGYIINDLINSGCVLDSSRRKTLLEMTLMGFGTQMEHNQLTIKATRDNFPLKKHSLLQAMLVVNDMFYLSAPHTISLFYDDVIQWMDDSDIRYTPRIKLTGKSGFDNMFDFVIPKSKQNPERLLQIATTPNKDKIRNLMFNWGDIKDTRGIEVKSYTVLNDKEMPVLQSVIDAVDNYDSTPILWSERECFVEALS
jgi:hypothetical protein